eukprot:gene9691-13044_t
MARSYSGDEYKSSKSDVIIESPSMNSRKITASIIINCPMQTVWDILTDYNNLATHVPNLVQSYLVNSPTNGINNNNNNQLRLFQEGAQKIIGFDFRAALTMDMIEEKEDENRAMRGRNLTFKLIESKMFSSFDGNWSLRYHSRSKEYDNRTQTYYYAYKTKLTYCVYVRPKGPVPVIALEWRIKEDIPVNLAAVKLAAEKLYISQRNNNNSKENNDINNKKNDDNDDDNINYTMKKKPPTMIEWEEDETLGSYIANMIQRKQIPTKIAY